MAEAPFRQEYLWVHLLVLTTLFWTVLHFILATASVLSRIFFSIPFLSGWLEEVYQLRADQMHRGQTPNTDHFLQRALARGMLQTLGWLAPITALYLIGDFLVPWLDTVVSCLITYVLLPVHDWANAVIVNELLPRLPVAKS